MGSTIKLIFQTIAAGSGLAEVNKQTREIQGRLSKMGEGFSALSTHLGNVGGVIGRTLGALARGNIYGAAAQVGGKIIETLVDRWKKHNELMREARFAARGLTSDYRSLERQARQYQKRVEGYRKAAEEVREAEEANAKAAEEAAKAKIDGRRAAMKLERDYYSLEAQIAAEKAKQGLNSKDEITQLRTKVKLMLDVAKANVADKERKAAHAEENWKTMGGSGGDVDIAKKELELAKAKQVNEIAAAKQLVADYKARKAKEKADAEAAVEAQMEAMRREDFEREEQQKKREQGEKKIADIRKAAAEAVQRIEGQIAAAKKAGEEWGLAAGRARGKSFGDWDRGERDRAKDEANAERKQRNRERNVDAEIEKIEKTSPMARSKWAKDRLRKLRKWREFQNDENNPGNAVNDLEAKKQAILDKSEKHLAAIENAMKNMGL
jgi:hypothetical protein